MVWKNKFKKILAIFDSNKFNHKNKIGGFKYNDIKDFVNNINKNTISKILARKHLNVLNKIKNAEIKNKRFISKQKELLHLFNNLFDTTLTENENNNNTDTTTTTTNNNNNNN